MKPINVLATAAAAVLLGAAVATVVYGASPHEGNPGKIAGVMDQSDWVVVEALGDGTVCALFIGGVSG